MAGLKKPPSSNIHNCSFLGARDNRKSDGGANGPGSWSNPEHRSRDVVTGVKDWLTGSGNGEGLRRTDAPGLVLAQPRVDAICDSSRILERHWGRCFGVCVAEVGESLRENGGISVVSRTEPLRRRVVRERGGTVLGD
ncbi:hypothetical protein AA313_de0205770 [Arthrobotrys entomopaga]|nr:hypothetical protein AA313_de0205770 [Arthrobotrys entomopaga]